MDAPSTGWVTVLAGLLARGSLPLVRPSQLPSGRRWTIDSPLTVAGAAADFRENCGLRVPSFVSGANRRTSTLKCSLDACVESRRRQGPNNRGHVFGRRG